MLQPLKAHCTQNALLSILQACLNLLIYLSLIIVEYQANSGNRTSSHDAWRLVYASGSMNNQWQSRHLLDTNQNSSTWWKTQTSVGGSFINYNSGRSGSDGNNDYHYLPDDYTNANEWLFRENLDDDCGTANSSNVPSIFLIR